MNKKALTYYLKTVPDISEPMKYHKVMEKSCFALFSFMLICNLLSSCEKSPVFNLIGQKEYPSEDFMISPPLALENIKRVGSVWGTPGASPDSKETGGAHNGIDIGADEGTSFIAAAPGIISRISESEDYYRLNTDVALAYNSEFTLIYLFEPAKKIDVGLYQSVEKGNVIGYLGSREAGYIDQCVHFGVKRNGLWICPVPYLKEDLRKKLNEVYHSLSGRESSNLCNCPEHQFYFE